MESPLGVPSPKRHPRKLRQRASPFVEGSRSGGNTGSPRGATQNGFAREFLGRRTVKDLGRGGWTRKSSAFFSAGKTLKSNCRFRSRDRQQSSGEERSVRTSGGEGNSPREVKPMRGAVPVSFTADRSRTFPGHQTLKWRPSANHKRVAALERAFGSANGIVPEGQTPRTLPA